MLNIFIGIVEKFGPEFEFGTTIDLTRKKVIDKSCFRISNTDFAQSVLVTKTSMLGLNCLGASSKMSKVYLFDKFFINKSFLGKKVQSVCRIIYYVQLF